MVMLSVDVVGLGLNAMDTICVVDRFPMPNTKTGIRSVRREPGGQVATAMATCARLGLSTRYIGSVSDDDLGTLFDKTIDSATPDAAGTACHNRNLACQ